MRRSTVYAAALLACLAVVAVYWRGLDGGFLLDDFENLAPVERFIQGETDWRPAVFDNRSGPLHRPVAMATFTLDAAFWGLHAAPMKATNLAIHLLCGLLIVALVRRLLGRSGVAPPPASAGALLIGAVWLLLPIHVSTVLYVVQRMAQLSALFTLLALLAYVVGRSRAESSPRRAAACLFVAFPVAATLAAFSKENGLLAAPLAGVIELAWFAPTAGARRPRLVQAFFACFLLLPGLAALAFLASHPSFVLAGYSGRDFSLGERLLTEPRVLLDYARAILLPYSPSLGLIHDHYAKSQGLLTPPSTLLAIACWLGALVATWRVRARHPLLYGGLLFFLTAHALEAGIYPLELYFEHRNYLASLGLLLVVAGLVQASARALPGASATLRRVALVAAGLAPLALATASHGRALVWSSVDLLLQQSLEQHPESPRLRSMLAARSMGRGDLATALEHIAAAERAERDGPPALFALWRLLAYCETATPPPAALVATVRDHGADRISSGAMKAFELVAARAETGACAGLEVDALIAAGRRWLERTDQADSEHESWRVRYNVARLLASRERWEEAIREAERAWVGSLRNRGVGVLLFQLNASVGDVEACRGVYAKLLSQSDGSDHSFERALESFGRFVAGTGKPAPISPPSTQLPAVPRP